MICPICGNNKMKDNICDVCEICGWEDDNIQQSDHPDVDIRLLNTLRKLSYSKIQNADYVKSLVVIGICLFMSKHGLKTTQLKYNSFDDLIIEYENIFDNLKD